MWRSISTVGFQCQNTNKDVIAHARIQRGGGAGGPDPHPLKNHKNIGFLSNSGPDPLKKKHHASKAAFNVGSSSARQRSAITLADR